MREKGDWIEMEGTRKRDLRIVDLFLFYNVWLYSLKTWNRGLCLVIGNETVLLCYYAVAVIIVRCK